MPVAAARSPDVGSGRVARFVRPPLRADTPQAGLTSRRVDVERRPAFRDLGRRVAEVVAVAGLHHGDPRLNGIQEQRR